MGLLVYISGPITLGHRIINMRNAIDAAERVAARGHIPYIPHLNDMWELVYPHHYGFWMRMDLAIVKRSDIVLRIPGKSIGADQEVDYATQLGIPVFHGIEAFMNSKYWTMEEVMKEMQE